MQEDHKEELEEKLNGKRILLIAPGRSSADESDKVLKEMKKPDVISISVNFDYQRTDYIFLSNLRRYRELDESAYGRCIVTSNITGDKVYLKTKYRDLLNDEDTVRDNAGLMAMWLYFHSLSIGLCYNTYFYISSNLYLRIIQ